MIDLVEKVNALKKILISVSTGEQRIQDINEEYQIAFRDVSIELKKLGLKNPNPFSDLWEWYGKWSSGEMPQYRQRRAYLTELFKDLLDKLESHNNFSDIEIDLVGWDRIERSIGEIKFRLGEAFTEEQFQSIGLLCRETIISLAQEVFNEDKHPIADGTDISNTDSKRMLDAYIMAELPGHENENLRKYAKSTNILANELTHKRTATIKLSKLCSSATINLVNLIRILEEE